MTKIPILKKEIQLYIKKGMNINKPAGVIRYEKNREPYYYIVKRSASDQLFKRPKYKDLLPISTTIITDLKKLNVNKVIAYLCLKDDRFFIVATRKEFENGELMEFDDRQRAINYSNKIRHYEFPRSLQEVLIK